MAALECGAWMWWRRSVRRPARGPRVFSAEFLAGLTGGIFLCHVLFINLVRTGLGDAGITPHLGWAGTVAVTFVLTMGSAALFTALLLHTPLRWVLVRPRARRAACPPRPGGAATPSGPSRRTSSWRHLHANQHASERAGPPARERRDGAALTTPCDTVVAQTQLQLRKGSVRGA